MMQQLVEIVRPLNMFNDPSDLQDITGCWWYKSCFIWNSSHVL